VIEKVQETANTMASQKAKLTAFTKDVIKFGLASSSAHQRAQFYALLTSSLSPKHIEDLGTADDDMNEVRSFFMEKFPSREAALLLYSIYGPSVGEVLLGRAEIPITTTSPKVEDSSKAETKTETKKAETKTDAKPSKTESKVSKVDAREDKDVRQKCEAIKKNGEPCGNTALKDSDPPRCGIHSKK